jgi:predicted transcriptional regulator
MITTLSGRIDTNTRSASRRSPNALGARSHSAEAIAAFVEAESWQLDEIQTGTNELDEGRGVPHKDVANWLLVVGSQA